MIDIALVHGRVRPEERLLLEAAERLGIAMRSVPEQDLVLDLDHGIDADAVLLRSISATRALHIAQACHAADVPVTNSPGTIATCMDKAATSLALRRAGIPTPETRIAFTPEAALAAFDQIGYPAVLKPVQGSWARMVHKVRDAAEAEQLIEAREQLPNPIQHVYYIQEAIDTRDGDRHRDVRAFVVGDATIAAIERRSDHWITNTARGATTTGLAVDSDLDELCQGAARAVGGGIVAIDLMQGPDGWLVHEVNHSMEFRNSIDVTGVDIPGAIVQHVAHHEVLA